MLAARRRYTMLIIEGTCFACGQTGPITALARRADGDSLAICHACARVPDRLHAFVAAYRAAATLAEHRAGDAPAAPPADSTPPPRVGRC
jgi:hypothetical protein